MVGEVGKKEEPTDAVAQARPDIADHRHGRTREAPGAAWILAGPLSGDEDSDPGAGAEPRPVLFGELRSLGKRRIKQSAILVFNSVSD